MNCADVDPLLGAYALDALPDDERRAVRDHLDGCNLHAEARALRGVASDLYKTVEPRTPPAALKSRLMAAALADQHADETPVKVVPLPAQPQRKAPAFLPYAAAAVFAIAAVGMFAWNLSLRGEDEPATLAATFPVSGDAGGEVVYLKDRQLVVLQVRGMDALGDEQTYQLWRIGDDGIESLGILGSAPDGGLAFSGELSETDAIGISVEPAGGSEQPTSDPILVARF